MSTNPFVIGQWVRGERFYGRGALIDEILNGNRDCLWLLGTRRIGKTSLLKQAELLSSTAEKPTYFPLFWDFQGAEDPQELHDSFGDALIDAADRLEELEISIDAVQNDDCFVSMSKIRRELKRRGLKLLLLCDEVEELIPLNKKDPRLLKRLRRAMQAGGDVRSVLASKINLWALVDEPGDTSVFLEAFTPPLYVNNFNDREALDLIRQAHLPDDSQPRFDDEIVEDIRTHCNNHPYLMQLLCERLLEMGDLSTAIEHVASDSMVSYFFSVDFEMLTSIERNIIRIISDHDSSTSNSIYDTLNIGDRELSSALQRLEQLGYIRRNAEGRFQLVNVFFKRWFAQPDQDDVRSASDSEISMKVVTPGSDTVTELGVVDGRYELKRKVGQGATGVVYKAFDRLMKVDIAVKLLKPQYSAHEEAVERLRREILLSRDIAHPNVIRIYHLGSFEGKKYLTMQWMAGVNLAAVIKKEGFLSTERTVRMAIKLAGAMGAAHKRKVLHRDIKPSNILVDSNDEPFVADFGLARLVGESGMTHSGVFVGTPDYASPEQAELAPLDERSDIYSLGVVLYEMVTGLRMFKSDSVREILRKQRYEIPEPPRKMRAEVPQKFSELVMRCLEKEPSKRYQSAKKLEQALRACT